MGVVSNWPASDAAVATLSLTDDCARAMLLTQIKTDPEEARPFVILNCNSSDCPPNFR